MSAVNIRAQRTPLGDWYAVDYDRYDGAPDAGRQCVGWGTTQADAIADLREQLAEQDKEWDAIGCPAVQTEPLPT